MVGDDPVDTEGDELLHRLLRIHCPDMDPDPRGMGAADVLFIQDRGRQLSVV